MKILGIDTSSTTASVALAEEGRLIAEEVRSDHRIQRDPSAPAGRMNHAETLFPLIDDLVRKARLPFKEIGALAVAIGPGSFTGLRIGLSSVKGLAYGWDIPVVGIPTLTAVAARVDDWSGLVCPFLDARKKEVYTALFRRERSGLIERLSEDLVTPPEPFMTGVVSRFREACLFIGDGTGVYGELIAATLDGRARATLGETYPSTAFAVARLAEEKVLKRENASVGTLVPLYLRPSEAELKLPGPGKA